MSGSDLEAEDATYEYDFKQFSAPKHIELETKFASKVNENFIATEISSHQAASIRNIHQKEDANRMRIKDKSDRATVELVLDNRTRLFLYSFINSGKISEIFGCVSAGKEANVYYATDTSMNEFAIKIYKTSILIFKDRNRYVEGEFRFRKGYSKHNPRKMVRMWAEKEMRNLRRLRLAGIPCPEPIAVKQNVLLMSFLGKDGVPAPRLKDVVFETNTNDFYVETVKLMRDIYHKCHLVHSDFSEYNLLYYNDQIQVIDVSQSVEHDHPQALYFLRRDCANINDFFKKNGATLLTVQGMFNYITDLTDMTHEERWEKAKNTEEISDEVFKEIYIPRTLQEIDFDQKNPELFEKLTGVKADSDTDESDSSDEDSQEEGEEEENEEEENEEEPEESGQKKSTPGDAIYSGLSKAERKQKVKEDKRDRRKTKIPKNVKKSKIRSTARKHRNLK
ncbi:unnamed protein product [Blepharisma stoltei]|uniref:Serine/threonine-protein kinase RIO1 n=1 Tax=Blepharisma stoltei TaxID=1481888 RepID=A0AAU9IYT1_9CILI|nr:unnamed protein product [Blepharisma stoltei]